MILDTDRFIASQPIVLKEDLSEIRFQVESDNPSKHLVPLRLSGLRPGAYELRDKKLITTLKIEDGKEATVELPVETHSKEFVILRRP